MIRRTCASLALLVFALPCFAQFTTVSGTVTDPNGLPYAYGTIASYIQATNTPRFTSTGQAYMQPSQASGLDFNGKFLVTLADNTQLSPGGSTWTFVVCSGLGTVQRDFGNGPICFTVTGITISGASQDIGATLRAAAPALTANFAAGGTGCSPLSTNSNGVVYLNSSLNCTTANNFSFFPGSSPTLSIGSTGAGNKVALALLGSGGTVDLVGPVPYFSDSSISTPSSTLGIGASGAANASLLIGSASKIDPCDIVSVTRAANVVTLVCGGSDFPVGVYITVSNVTDSSYNGNFLVASTSFSGTSQTLTYAQTGANSSSSGGFAALDTNGYNVFANAGQMNLASEAIYLYAGVGTDPANNPTGIQFVVGNTNSSIAGGPINFFAGSTTIAVGGFPAGNINLKAGSSYTSANSAGSINLVPGSSPGAGKGGIVNIATTTFANLPACVSGIEGSIRPVTDSNTIAWGAPIGGAGSNHVLAYCDGTNWTVTGTTNSSNGLFPQVTVLTGCGATCTFTYPTAYVSAVPACFCTGGNGSCNVSITTPPTKTACVINTTVSTNYVEVIGTP